MNVEWRPVVGFEGLYEVSSDGRVRRSLSAPVSRSTYPGRELNPDYSTGYARLSLTRDRKCHRLQVHRMVARAFLGEARPFAHVNHKDGDKKNNRVENLEWCSSQDNTRHAWNFGLCAPNSGESHGMSKLTTRDVEVIRGARARGIALSNIADVFGITESTVSHIALGKTWRHTA